MEEQSCKQNCTFPLPLTAAASGDGKGTGMQLFFCANMCRMFLYTNIFLIGQFIDIQVTLIFLPIYLPFPLSCVITGKCIVFIVTYSLCNRQHAFSFLRHATYLNPPRFTLDMYFYLCATAGKVLLSSFMCLFLISIFLLFAKVAQPPGMLQSNLYS